MTRKGVTVDALEAYRSNGHKTIIRIDSITSFMIHHNEKSDVMINGEYYTRESLKFCSFISELGKVVK